MAIPSGLSRFFGALRATGQSPGIGNVRPSDGVDKLVKYGAPIPSVMRRGARQRLNAAYQQSKQGMSKIMP